MYFKCFSLKMAQYFCRKGFKIIKKEPNFKQPKYDVFIFDKTPELLEAFDLYCNQK